MAFGKSFLNASAPAQTNDGSCVPILQAILVDIFADISEIKEFTEDTFIKGKMQVKLTVKSDCEDNCFYTRLSIVKKEGYYWLRDDINQISNFDKNYKPSSEIEMDFSFDEHSFVVKKGEKLRIDVSSSAFPLYVRHTNNKGLFSAQTTAKIAKNTIILDKSFLTIYFETHSDS